MVLNLAVAAPSVELQSVTDQATNQRVATPGKDRTTQAHWARAGPELSNKKPSKAELSCPRVLPELWYII